LSAEVRVGIGYKSREECVGLMNTATNGPAAKKKWNQ